MSSYSELIKNFEKIRAYMRDFYVYGFKSRDDYRSKSARSYDDERRRLESWVTLFLLRLCALMAHFRSNHTTAYFQIKMSFLSVD